MRIDCKEKESHSMSDQDQDEQMSQQEMQEMVELYGPLYPYSDYRRGESIKFLLRGSQVTGEIIWVTPPGPSPSGKYHASACYIVGVEDELFPALVYPSEVLEQ